MEKTTKVFGIGLNKTGTTTLGQCGRILGLRCTSCSKPLLEDFVLRSDLTEIRRVADAYDLFEDWPWPLIYRELDAMYPGSKFILTVRSSESRWLESLKKHSMRTHPLNHCRKLAYGYSYPHKHPAEHLEFYREHNRQVREYFAGRTDAFLEVCWENGDGLKTLCSFLGLECPEVSLPHANKGSEQRVSAMRFIDNYLRCVFSR